MSDLKKYLQRTFCFPALAFTFLLARYAASPLTGFVLDDWNYHCLAQRTARLTELAATGFQKDLNRPLSTLWMSVGFRLFGLNLWPYAALLVLSHLLILFLAVQLCRVWTGGDTKRACLFGFAFAVLPILTETFYFPTLAFVVTSLGMPLLLLSALAASRFAVTGSCRALIPAWLLYGLSLFCYEVGLLLPAAFVVLWWGKVPWRRSLLACSGFAAMFLLYVAWRETSAFGLLTSTTPPHMQAGAFQLSGILSNVVELAHWWMGRHLLHTLREGFAAFLSIPAGRRTLLLLANVLLCLLLLRRMAKADDESVQVAPPFSRVRLTLFALVWVAASSVPALLGYVVSRLLYLPAIGVLLLLVLYLPVRPKRWSILPGTTLLLLSLVADQGSNWSWRESGRAYLAVYHMLGESRGEWKDKSVILFDSRRLRAQKQDPDPIQAVAFHRNATLFRGSGLREMVWLLGQERQQTRRRLDVEYRAEIRDDQLILHHRFDPGDQVFETYPMTEVYLLDLQSALDRARSPDPGPYNFHAIPSPFPASTDAAPSSP